MKHRWRLVLAPYPEVRVWWIRNRVVYWQTSTDERRYGDGFATLQWFDQWELPDRGFREGDLSRGHAENA